MSNERDSDRYYATYKRFPRAGTESSIRIGKMSSMAKCLDEALTEIIQESEGTESSNTRTAPPQALGVEVDTDQIQVEVPVHADEHEDGDEITIDEQFKNKIMDQFGTATSKAFCSEETKTILSKPEECEPPAGILHGKVKYYNRFHGQWRILVSDAEIRPRVNLNYDKLKKREVISLKTCSSRSYMEKETRQKRRRIDIDIDADPDLPVMNQDGSVKIDGDLMILAYDDQA
jgi:hypothetical protein